MILCRSRSTRRAPYRRPFFQLQSSTPKTRTGGVVGGESFIRWRRSVEAGIVIPSRSARRVPSSPPATNPMVCTSARRRVFMRAYDSTSSESRSVKILWGQVEALQTGVQPEGPWKLLNALRWRLLKFASFLFSGFSVTFHRILTWYVV